MDEKHGMTCSTGLETFHRVLDGDLMEARERQRMEDHLAGCSECAEKAAQLSEMQDLLRAMAEQPMPDHAMDEVLERTVKAPAVRRRPRWRDWRFAAAAAAVVAASWIGFKNTPERTPGHDLAAQQAAQEVRMVLQLTANALRKSEQVAFREVFAEEVSPALRRIGILWPSAAREQDANEGSI